MKTKGESFVELVALVDRLRGPGGCPWDREQSFESLKPLLLEEAYEVLHALDTGDHVELAAELGDLLFQVVFLSHIAQEEGAFQIDDVIRAILTKMVRRHPHVFGEMKLNSSQQVLENWELIKQAERRQSGAAGGDEGSVIGGLASMPALLTASKLGSKASRVGFDWPNIHQVIEKLQEELEELKEALGSAKAPDDGFNLAVEQEIGDLLFVIVNIARFANVDPETALRKTNRKFSSRFQYMEQKLRESGKDIRQATLAEMEELWQEAKTVLAQKAE
ncbi:MAG: nucleoside triphosphate pyrophosphohydrolase [Acidobacteriota bacterium]